MDTMNWTLPTMTCSHCVRAVTEAVHGVDAAARVDIDLPSHTLKVDSAAAPDALRAALVSAGYTPA